MRLGFSRISGLLPLRRVYEDSHLLAFEHPAPAWSPHLLIVPKRPLRSFWQIRPPDDLLFGEMVRLAFSLAERHELYGNGFAVLVNGGAYQDMPQLHLHVAGLDRGLTYAAPSSRPGQPIPDQSGLVAFEHPEPRCAVHVVIMMSSVVLTWRHLNGPQGEGIGRVLVGLGQRLVARYGLASRGFTLLASVLPGGADDAVCFHLVGGARRET